MRPLRLFLVLFAAEIGSTVWFLLRTPFDSPTDHMGFMAAFGGRLLCWIPIAVVIRALCFLPRWRLAVSVSASEVTGDQSWVARGCVRFVLYVAIGFAIEALTSVCYWKTPWSKAVRELYESSWYDRSSLRGYLLDHASPWLVFFLLGLAILHFVNRRQAGRPTYSASK